MDNAQWENILRSVSAERAFSWLNGGEITPVAIAEFLLLDRRMPRSLAFCHSKILENLDLLENDYGQRQPCQDLSEKCTARFRNRRVSEIFEEGLHEFLESAIHSTAHLAAQIEQDYRFYG